MAIRIAIINKTPPLVQVNQSRTATLCVVFKPPLPVSIGGFSKLKQALPIWIIVGEFEVNNTSYLAGDRLFESADN